LICSSFKVITGQLSSCPPSPSTITLGDHLDPHSAGKFIGVKDSPEMQVVDSSVRTLPSLSVAIPSSETQHDSEVIEKFYTRNTIVISPDSPQDHGSPMVDSFLLNPSSDNSSVMHTPSYVQSYGDSLHSQETEDTHSSETSPFTEGSVSPSEEGNSPIYIR
jgi:hypothetical protein